MGPKENPAKAGFFVASKVILSKQKKRYRSSVFFENEELTTSQPFQFHQSFAGNKIQQHCQDLALLL